MDTKQWDSAVNALTKTLDASSNKLSKSVTAVNAWITALNSAVTIVQELDSELVLLNQTTNITEDELKRIYAASNDIARSLGVSTKAIITATRQWTSLGYSIKEAQSLAKNAVILERISPDLDISKSTRGLSATIKAFEMDANDNTLEGVISKISSVGKEFSVSNGDIVEILTNSSAAMAAANNTLKQTIALGTAGTALTRNAAGVGQALKSTSIRISGYEKELRQLSGTVADLTKTAFTPGGISLFTDDKAETAKSTYQLLEEISSIWSDLAESSQVNLLEALAGDGNSQALEAIILNFDTVKSSMSTMTGSAGAAMNELELVYDSIAYKTNRLSETGVNIAQNLFMHDDMKLVIDTLTGVASILDLVTEKIGLLGTTAAGVGIFSFVKNFDWL